ncbi:MarR family winged helix-turn-helix transcriptional regulator [Pedobacter sp. SYSU D00535]|uniref:MarR family winged helix-turn-helix transcriptional regulator n=1 Tax=Pedobacter sp. SYSU D00535 TaxID=2810308 RepID=UPI001A97BE21|nr:MarR family transcriptional regulator [Pedobacter sp. SYSU D00535]
MISVTKKYLSVFSQQTKGLDIDRYQYVLVVIDDQLQPPTQKALAEHFEVDKSFMVTMINYLSEKGYVYREQNESDKRQQLIKLTEKGKEAVPVIRAVVEDLNRKSLEHLTIKQIETFMEVLNRIDSNLLGINPFNIIINYKK